MPRLHVDADCITLILLGRDMLESMSCSADGFLAVMGSHPVRLRDGLNELSAALHTLSMSLDAVVFRDTWRAVAIAVMRLLFNDIATEAQFSPEVSRRDPRC